jgi:hypothetical protein
VSEPNRIGEVENYAESGGLRSQEDSFGLPERLQIQVYRAIMRFTGNEFPIQPIAWIGRAPVAISTLTGA